MNKCKKCGEFISDEFETCYECKQPKKEKEKSYQYSNSTKVNEIYKHIVRESFIRSFFDDAVNTFENFPATESTWGSNGFKNIKYEYEQRIKKGKVKVFYLDVVEHLIKELEKKLINHKSFFGFYNKSRRIKDINEYYRFVAYYQALLELKVEHRTT